MFVVVRVSWNELDARLFETLPLWELADPWLLVDPLNPCESDDPPPDAPEKLVDDRRELTLPLDPWELDGP